LTGRSELAAVRYVDVEAAGDWKDEGTMLKAYQQADPETIRNVVLHPTHRLVSR